MKGVKTVMKIRKELTLKLKKTIIEVAKKSAEIEANTACPFLNFQSKESKAIKQLRKF